MTIIDVDAKEAWEGFSQGTFRKDDRIERMGIYHFNGRVQKADGPSDGKISLEIVTLEEESNAGLGIARYELRDGSVECTDWNSVERSDPSYERLQAYSQGEGSS